MGTRFTTMKIYYCIFYFHIFLPARLVVNSFQRNGTCIYNSSIVHCCIHYFKNDQGVCKECPTGFTSKGFNCTGCQEPYFGQRCSYTCHCSMTEMCDNVFGCVSKSSSNFTFTENEVNRTDSTVDPFMKFTSFIATAVDSTKFEFNVVYYIAVAGILIIAVLLCLVLIHVWKKCRYNTSQEVNVNPTPTSQYVASALTDARSCTNESNITNQKTNIASTSEIEMNTYNGKPNDEHSNNKNNPRNKDSKPYLEMKPKRDTYQNHYLEMKHQRERYLNLHQPMKIVVDIHEQDNCAET